jgi:hypothetical protein
MNKKNQITRDVYPCELNPATQHPKLKEIRKSK